MDVVAINWHKKSILLGECKWGTRPVGRTIIRELVKKTPQVLPGEGWKVHYAFFARAGFTQAAREEAQKRGAIVVDLDMLDEDLRSVEPA